MFWIKLLPSRKPDHTPPNYWMFGRFLWMIFGNSDDPEPVERFYPETWSRTLKRIHWLFVRNPLHNLMFYLVGVADKERLVTGKNIREVLPDGFNWIITKYRFFYLPYISYQKSFNGKKFQFYIGWRLFGAFGFKLRITNNG